MGPGFDADEDAAHLGERLSLPPKFEHLRDQVERTLTPLPDPRASARPPTSLTPLRAPGARRPGPAPGGAAGRSGMRGRS